MPEGTRIYLTFNAPRVLLCTFSSQVAEVRRLVKVTAALRKAEARGMPALRRALAQALHEGESHGEGQESVLLTAVEGAGDGEGSRAQSIRSSSAVSSDLPRLLGAPALAAALQRLAGGEGPIEPRLLESSSGSMGGLDEGMIAASLHRVARLAGKGVGREEGQGRVTAWGEDGLEGLAAWMSEDGREGGEVECERVLRVLARAMAMRRAAAAVTVEMQR